MFNKVTYTNKQNKQQPMYTMTRDGLKAQMGKADFSALFNTSTLSATWEKIPPLKCSTKRLTPTKRAARWRRSS